MNKLKTGLLAIALMFGFLAFATGASAATSFASKYFTRIAPPGILTSSQPRVLGASTDCYAFSRDLTIGNTGDDVVALQNFLVAKGDLASTNVTGYFGSYTQAGVAKYQASKNISPASGYFGVTTRAALLAEICPSGVPTVYAIYGLTAIPTIQASGTDANGVTTALTATFSFNLVAHGTAVAKPTASNLKVVFLNSTGQQTYAPTVENVVTIPNTDIADGASANVTVTAQIQGSALPSTGLYGAQITLAASSTAGASVTLQQVPTTDSLTTGFVNFSKTGTSAYAFTNVKTDATSYVPGNVANITWTTPAVTAAGNPIVDIMKTDGSLVASIGQSTNSKISWAIPSNFVAGTYIIRVTTDGAGDVTDGTSTPFTITSSGSAPTATLLANGASTLTVNVGDSINYTWTSSNANQYSSSYTSDNCGNGATWVANSSNSTGNSYVTPANEAGCTFTITYVAKNTTTGASANSVITVKVNGTSGGTTAAIVKNQFYRLVNSQIGDHFYTTDASESARVQKNQGYTLDGNAGFLTDAASAGAVPFYRLYSGAATDHFYTADASEMRQAIQSYGYRYDTIAGYIYTTQVAGTVPLYRFYSSAYGDHFYTDDGSERPRAHSYGYTLEGIAGYVYPSN